MFRLLNACLVHFDENGSRISGSRQWLHVASEPSVTLFTTFGLPASNYGAPPCSITGGDADTASSCAGTFFSCCRKARRTTIVCQAPPDWEERKKNKPRSEWGRFESWQVTAPAFMDFPEDLARPREEGGVLLSSLVHDCLKAAGRGCRISFHRFNAIVQGRSRTC